MYIGKVNPDSKLNDGFFWPPLEMIIDYKINDVKQFEFNIDYFEHRTLNNL